MIKFFPYSWDECISTDEQNTILCAWSYNEKGEKILVQVRNYYHPLRIELPFFIEGNIVNWKNKANIVAKFLKNICKEGLLRKKMSFSMMNRLYYHDPMKYPVITCYFKTKKQQKGMVSFLKKPVLIYGLSKNPIQLKVWEDYIDTKTKFFAMNNISPITWLESYAEEVDPRYRRTESLPEYKVNGKDISISEDQLPPPKVKIMIMDIETNSRRMTSFPNMYEMDDEIFMISFIIERYREPENRERYLYVTGLFPEPDDKSLNFKIFNSEEELILGYLQAIQDHGPDVITQYNGFAFDWEYIDTRLRLHGCNRGTDNPWPRISQDLYDKTVMYENNRTKDKKINYPKANGICHIDICSYVKTNEKLRKYSLKYVASLFVKDKSELKRDIEPQDIFRAYRITRKPLESFSKKRLKKWGFKNTSIDYLRNFIKDVIDYSDGDVRATSAVGNIMGFWDFTTEVSNVCYINPITVWSKGTQNRTDSLIYQYAYKNNIFVDSRENIITYYKGGNVMNIKPGLSTPVVVPDYNSLYPSIMIAHNICYTTFIPEKDWDLYEPDDYITIKCSDDKIKMKNDKPEDEGKMRHFEYRYWIKDRGLLPSILTNLLDQRGKYKKLLKEVDPESMNHTIYDSRQKALKITANAVYGYSGAVISKLPMLELAMSVTAKGREKILWVNDVFLSHGATIVYGDTDSTMITVKGYNPKEMMEFSSKIIEYINSKLDHPMRIEIEKMVHFFGLKKKHYMYIIIDKEGNNISPIQAKGVVTARRELCSFILDMYSEIAEMIFSREGIRNILIYWYEQLGNLLKGNIPPDRLTLNNKIGSSYKNDNSFMKIFSDYLKDMGYSYQEGDRLEYLIVKTDDRLYGKKLRPYIEYMKSEDKEDIDYAYYLRKMNSIKSLIDAEVSSSNIDIDREFKGPRMRKSIPITNPTEYLLSYNKYYPNKLLKEVDYILCLLKEEIIYVYT
jgi:DNA polymerase delta subunit 1